MRSRSAWFFISLAIVFLVAGLFAYYQGGIFTADSSGYILAAHNLQAFDTLYAGDFNQDIDPAMYSLRPFGYPIFLLLCKQLSGSVGLFVLILQMACSLSAIGLLLKTYELWIGKRVDRLYVFLLILVTPSLWIYPSLIMSETLLQLLIALFAYAAVRYWQQKSITMAVLAIFSLLLAAFTKPVMYPILLLCCVCAAAYWIYSKKTRMLYVLLLPILALGAYQYRNWKQCGRTDFSSIEAINLCNYNTYYLHVQVEGMANTKEVYGRLKEECATLTYQNKVARMNAFSISYLSEHAIAYAWFHCKGMLRFFIDPGRFDLITWLGIPYRVEQGLLQNTSEGYSLKALSERLSMSPVAIIGLALLALFNLLKIGFLAWLMLRKGRSRHWIWLLPLLLIAFLSGPLGASRFMMPVALFVVIPCADALGLCLSRRGLPCRP